MESLSPGRLRALGRFFLDSVFPQFCIGCSVEGAALCRVCCASATPMLLWFCPMCMEPCSAQVGRCASCVGDIDGLVVMARARDAMVRRAIHEVKFGFREPIAVTLGERLGELLATASLPEVATVIPVPLSGSRMVVRDFNQALRIAQGMVRFVDRPQWNLDLHSLVRTRATRAQATLQGRDGRFTNVAGAFTAQNSVSGSVVLVDDIITTGATIQACAHALRSAGATQVFAVGIAHG